MVKGCKEIVNNDVKKYSLRFFRKMNQEDKTKTDTKKKKEETPKRRFEKATAKSKSVHIKQNKERQEVEIFKA